MPKVEADPFDFIEEDRYDGSLSVKRSELVQFLRSNALIGNDLRSWLADLFDDSGQGQFKIEIMFRKGGQQKRAAIPFFEAVTLFLELKDLGWRTKAAFFAVQDKFPEIGRSTLLASVKLYREGKAASQSEE